MQQVPLQIHCARACVVRRAAVLPWTYSIARRLLIDGHRLDADLKHRLLTPDPMATIDSRCNYCCYIYGASR